MILIEPQNEKDKLILTFVSTLTPRFKVQLSLLKVPLGSNHQQWSIWNE